MRSQVMFIANDATINGGAFYPETLKKILRAQAIAEANHLPTLYFVDGGGANLNAGSGGESKNKSDSFTPSVGFVIGGLQFKNQAVMSGKRIPQLGVTFGTCTAGAAYTAAMCDELIMVKGSTVFLGGPPLVRAATGEVTEEQALGGALMHNSRSGVADALAVDEQDALVKIRESVRHLAPPRYELSGIGRREVVAPRCSAEELMGVIPEDNKLPLDVREVGGAVRASGEWTSGG